MVQVEAQMAQIKCRLERTRERARADANRRELVGGSVLGPAPTNNHTAVGNGMQRPKSAASVMPSTLILGSFGNVLVSPVEPVGADRRPAATTASAVPASAQELAAKCALQMTRCTSMSY